MVAPNRQNGRLKIPLLMVEERAGSNGSTSKVTSSRNILIGNAPENNIDGEKRIFPAGICLI